MSEYTLLQIWGYHTNINRFIDAFTNYTVEQDYQNVEYIPGKGYVITMLVCVKETKYLRIDSVAREQKVAYTGMTKTGGCCAPSNIALNNTKENVLAVLEGREAVA